MHKQDEEKNQIISLLQRIQKGYTERDLDQENQTNAFFLSHYILSDD
ncbi:MAG: hypothetical protein KMY55_11355 [Dethiosulfatibacter sp.]|nr:hypothetical protein [Dethiosulfatibacter sp.]